jgi:putative oxidoreductase
MSGDTIATAARRPNQTLHMLRGWHCAFVKLANSLQSPFLLLVRLYWGWQFMTTGWGKLHNLPRVTEFFSSLGLPAPAFTAQAIATLEFLGGILLIVGLANRVIGLLLSGNMLVAYLVSDREALKSIFSDPGKFYNADPFTFLMASLIVLIFGAGYFSLDYALSRRKPARR